MIVSFVGETDWPNPHVYADSGVPYDWRFLAGLDVFIVTKPGIDASDAIRGIYAVLLLTSGIGYPQLIDIERKQAACVIGNRPVRLWQQLAHSQEIFG